VKPDLLNRHTKKFLDLMLKPGIQASPGLMAVLLTSLGAAMCSRCFAANHCIMVPDWKLWVAANSKHSQPRPDQRGLLAYGHPIALELPAVLMQFLDGAVWCGHRRVGLLETLNPQRWDEARQEELQQGIASHPGVRLHVMPKCSPW